MDLHSVLPFITAAIVAAAVAWALGTMLPSAWQGARVGLAIAAAVIGGLNGPRMFPFLATPSAQIERDLLAAEDFGEVAHAWKSSDPESFSEYVASIALAYRGDRAGALERGRSSVAAAARPRMLNLSDERLVAYLALQRDLFLDLKDKEPEFCRAIYFSEPVPSPSLPVNEDLSRRQAQIFADAFRAPPQNRSRLDDDAYSEALSLVLDGTARVVGEDVAMLTREAPIVDEARFCTVAAEMFNQMAALDLAGPFYRTSIERTMR